MESDSEARRLIEAAIQWQMRFGYSVAIIWRAKASETLGTQHRLNQTEHDIHNRGACAGIRLFISLSRQG